MNSVISKDNKHKYYFDFLRIISIYMVMLNHTGTKCFVLFTNAVGKKLYGFYLVNSVVIKIAVPIFFMISGAVLIPKKESATEIIKKRVTRIAAALLVGSLFSYLYSLGWKIGKFDFIYFIKNIYTNRFATSYWFLYSYMSFLLILPLIKKLAKSMSRNDFNLLIALNLLKALLVTIDWLFFKGKAAHNSNIYFLTNIQHFIYPLLGYYFDQNRPNKKTLMKMVLGSAISLIICGILTHNRCVVLNVWEEENVQIFFKEFILLPTCTFFCLVQHYFDNHNVNEKTLKIIKYLGSCSFGITLMEHILRKKNNAYLLASITCIT